MKRRSSVTCKNPLDEFDLGIRIHLNFAHTFGHAFEAVSDYAIPHGTAVAMGMIMANAIAAERGSITKGQQEAMDRLLSSIIDLKLLAEENGFAGLQNFRMDQILDKIKKDKKQVDDRITAVLFADADLNLSVVHDVKRVEIESAYEHLTSILR